jgi:hypothetical protein
LDSFAQEPLQEQEEPATKEPANIKETGRMADNQAKREVQVQ